MMEDRLRDLEEGLLLRSNPINATKIMFEPKMEDGPYTKQTHYEVKLLFITFLTLSRLNHLIDQFAAIVECTKMSSKSDVVPLLVLLINIWYFIVSFII